MLAEQHFTIEVELAFLTPSHAAYAECVLSVFHAHIVASLQCVETAADTAESIQTTGRQNKSQNLVQTKKEHQGEAGSWKRTTGNKGKSLWMIFFNLRGIHISNFC